MTAPEKESGEDTPTDARIVEIFREPVELYKILKFEGMVTSGGQAKGVVAAGQVLVNGKVETQKRKKIVAGNTIEFNNETIVIKLGSANPTGSPAPKAKAEPVAKIDVIEEASDNSTVAGGEKSES